MNENIQNDTLGKPVLEENLIEPENIAEDTIDTVTPNDIGLSEDGIARDTDEKSDNSVSETKEDEPFISVRYNHKNKNFNKEEAINYIQKGMHTESLRTKLEYIAALRGVDVNKLVDDIVSAPEKAYRKRLEDLYGKDSSDIEIGMEIYREKQSENYKKIVAERENGIEKEKEKVEKSVYSRLADEYINLKKEIPNVPDYTELPDSVIIEAAEGKRDLSSAYLHYMYKEKMKIDAAKKIEEAANGASLKSMKSAESDIISSEEKHFLNGLWHK